MDKPGFIGEVDFQSDHGGTEFTVQKPITFVAKDGTVVTIPAGFTTRLASLPDLAQCGVVAIFLGLLLHRYANWWFLFGVECLPIFVGFVMVWFSSHLHHGGRFTSAAILLDWLYATKPFDRERCDQLFREALEDCHTEEAHQLSLFWAVRGWGLYAWRRAGNRQVVPPGH